MVEVNEIYNDGKILNYKPDTDLSLDMFIFGKTNIVDQLNIYNFEQDNPNDFILRVTNINKNTGPPDIFNSQSIIVNQNLTISTLNTNITNVFNNEGNALIKGNLYLEDKFIASNYLIKDNLTSRNNLLVSNTNRFSDFLLDMNIDGFNNEGLLIMQDFIVENNIITKKNVFINSNLNSNIINYNNITINDTLKIFNNFNSFANLNINKIKIGNTLNTKSIIVNDSLILNNHALFLPNISNDNDMDGSLRFNNLTNNIEAYIVNNWNVLNELQNLENTSRIKHQEHFKSNIGSNIDFIQNHNTTMTINSNNKTLEITHKNVNMNNIYIANNLNIYNKFNITENTNITGNVLINDNLIINNGLLVISSNNNSINSSNNIKNGSLRYNNFTDLYEIYINKWKPLQQITNNNNTSNVDLYPKNNNEYNTILFNSNKSILLNINEISCNFKTNNINIKQNLTTKNNLYIDNNINTQILNINNNKIFEQNGVLINDILVNGIQNKLVYEKLFITNNIDLDLVQFDFYSSKITTNLHKCNTINHLVSSNTSIINYSIYLTNYKIYNDIYITKFIIYLNQIIPSTSFILKINNTIYNITINEQNYISTTIEQLIEANTDLYISISSQDLLENVYATIYLYGSYKNVKGVLKTAYSSNIINTNHSNNLNNLNNIFEEESRIIQGNTIINKNLNILNNYNSVIPHLHITNKIGIGTNNITNKDDFIVKNNNDILLVHKNNKLALHRDVTDAKLVINCNNIYIDKNIDITGTLHVTHNLNHESNLNIQNTLITNNILPENLNIKNSITYTQNVSNDYNINVSNNLNVSNLIIMPNLLFTENNLDNNPTNNSNIIFKNNILYYNINSELRNTNYFPSFNSNNIYLEENTNINFKYNNKNLLNITPNSFSTNKNNINSNHIFSISNNFNISKNEIHIKSPHFIVNNIDLIEKIKSFERYYYTPYNINITKSIRTPYINNDFNITYNRPEFYYNLNNRNTHQIKKIDFIGFQFCLGNTNSHLHPNWTTNSFIYYKNINDINFINNIHHYNSQLGIGSINKTDYMNSNVKYDFNNVNNVNNIYNINIANDKSQLIYNNNNISCIFTNDLQIEQSITLRMFPIYNIRENDLYYSNPINFTLL